MNVYKLLLKARRTSRPTQAVRHVVSVTTYSQARSKFGSYYPGGGAWLEHLEAVNF